MTNKRIILSALCLAFGVITSVIVVSMISADYATKNSARKTSFIGELQGLFHWNSDDNRFRAVKSLHVEPKLQDADTNPDAPNSELTRVPYSSMWQLSLRQTSRNNDSDTANEPVKTRNKRGLGPLRSRGLGINREVTFNGKVYGKDIPPEEPLEEGATTPLPRVIDSLAHLRNRPLTAEEEEHQRRHYITNERYQFYQGQLRRNRESKRLLQEMMEKQKQENKNPSGNVASKRAQFLKWFRSQRKNPKAFGMERRPYEPPKYYSAPRKKYPWERRTWAPKTKKRNRMRPRG